ncbi:MFS transporter [Paenibacillus cremeus]|nr:MFS transporter [Paenibacillus cremeus]
MIITIINIVNIINQFIVAGTKPVITLYASQLGATPSEIGLLVSVFAFLPAFLAVHIGKWIDKYGVRRLVAFGGTGIVVSLIVPILMPNLITFIFSQALMGIAFTCQVVALQKRVGNNTDNVDKRIAMFGLYSSLGAMLGPLVSTFIYEKAGFSLSYAANGFAALIAVGTIYAVKKGIWEVSKEAQAPKFADHENKSVWSMLRNRELRNAVITSGLAISSKEIFSAYFPLLGEKLGMTPTTIGLILSIMGGAAMIIRFGQHPLVQHFGRGHVLTWSLYLSGLIYILTANLSAVLVIAVLVTVLGASLGLGQPLSLAYAIQVSPLERRGEVLGMRITFNRVSQTLIPALFGGIGGVAGLTIIFVASGVMLLVGGFMTRPKIDPQKVGA